MKKPNVQRLFDVVVASFSHIKILTRLARISTQNLKTGTDNYNEKESQSRIDLGVTEKQCHQWTNT